MAIFARLNLCILQIKLISSDTLFTCCLLLCNYYTLNYYIPLIIIPLTHKQFLCLYLFLEQARNCNGLRGVEATHLFCLFTSPDVPPL